MKTVATVNLNFPSEKRMKIILDALGPETRISSKRSRVHVEGEDNRLTLIFEAKDTISLRAALNSFLHWVRLTKDVLDTMETF